VDGTALVRGARFEVAFVDIWVFEPKTSSSRP